MTTEPETIDGEAQLLTEKLPAVRQHEAVVARQEITVDELLGQRTKITDVMQRAMVKDTHYGIIPGTSKPALLKPGAELLNVLLRLAPSYKSERTFHDDGHLTVVSYCTLTHIPTGLVISGGEGLCSTRETKYAYRQGGRVCPACGKPAIIKGKAEYGGGWVCFKKKDGCGEKFADGTPEAQVFENAEVGRVANDDLADSYNTVLKMADKRALIAAVLNGTAASDVFTQDVEEIANQGGGASTFTAGAAAGVAAPRLPDSFPVGDDLGARIGEALKHADSDVDWRATWENANQLLYGKPRAELPPREKAESLIRLANVADSLTGEGDFPPPTDDEIMSAFASAFDDILNVRVVYHEPVPVTGDVEPDDQIPFGEEK